jgi:predicted DNA-binding transcriptional regulator AlpA
MASPKTRYIAPVEDRLLDVHEVAAMLGRARSTVWSDVKLGIFPAPLRVGRRNVRWRKSLVEAYIGRLEQVQYDRVA